MIISPEYISIGGNRNPAAADWDAEGVKLLAFGADNSIALWDPSVGYPVFSTESIVFRTLTPNRTIICRAFDYY
jgi:hypothetical protein